MKTKPSGNEVIAFVALLTCICMTCVFVGYRAGDEDGHTRANLTMWETPPNMAYCVVYPDGGKKCVAKAFLPKIDVVECIRQCRISTRMEKVK